MTRPDALAVGARVAGAVVALGYLLGLVDGPVEAALGGLGLVTIGRAAAGNRREDVLAGGSLAVIAAATIVGALRWGSLDLVELRGVQAVLGPTLLVSPQSAAAASWVAAGAATLALGSWLASARVRGRLGAAGWLAEGVIAALVVATVFWAPGVEPGAVELARSLGAWAGITITVVAAASGLALLQRRLGLAWAWGCVAASGVATIAAAAVLASLA